MTDPIRTAAQALADIVMKQCGGYQSGPGFEAAEKARALNASLSAPKPADVSQSTADYWLQIRAGVIAALAERGLQIVSNTRGVSVVPLNIAQPAADERVKEHMKHVEASAAANNLARYALDDFIAGKPAGGLEAVNARCAEAAEALSAAQASARALLAAGREDAEHAAMYRWFRLNREVRATDGTMLHVYDEDGCILYGDELDAAIRTAMQKGTP